MIHFITGRAASGKSYEIYREIKKSLEEGHQKNILLVPEQFTLQAEADLIAKMNLPGLLNAEVISFRRLSFRILNETGGIKNNVINQTGKVMILRKIFEEHADQLHAFGNSYREDGFIHEFSNLLAECKKNDITIEKLQTFLKEPECGQILHSKLSDLILISSAMEEMLQDRFVDEDDQLHVVAEQIPLSEWLRGARVWIDGFHSFSSQEYKVLEKLFLSAESATISLTTDPDLDSGDYDVFEVPQYTMQKIKTMAERLGLPQKTSCCRAQYQAPDMIHVQNNIYSYPFETYCQKTENITIFSALHPFLEVKKMASDMITLARDYGYRWQDMAIVTNDADTYSPLVKRIFAEHNIPVFIDEKKGILTNPLIVYIKTFLKIAANDFRFEDVFSHIKTGFTDLTADQAEELENYVLEFGIKGYKWKKEAPDPVLEKYRSTFFVPLEKTTKIIRKKQSALVFARELYEYLRQNQIPEKTEDRIETLKNKGQLEKANEYSQIWNLLMALLDQIVEILGEQEMTLHEFTILLESGLSAQELGMIPPTMDQVLFGNLERSKSHDIKALFILGANEGLLPRAYEEKGILGDDDIVQLQHFGFEWPSDFLHKSKAEKFLIYSMISKPSEKLFLYYSISNLEGKAMQPSPVVLRIKKIFSLYTDSDLSSGSKDIRRYLTTPLATFNYLPENLRLAIDFGVMDQSWWTIWHWYQRQDSWANHCELLKKGLFYDVQEKQMQQENVSSGLFSDKQKFSISRLETYSQCPFKHYISYGLRPHPRKEYELKMPDLGTLYHDAIEAFSRKAEALDHGWHNIKDQQAQDMIEEIINEMSQDFQNGIFDSSGRTAYMKEKVKRVAKRAVSILVRQLQQGQFVPFEYEIAFTQKKEPKATLPPLQITTSEGIEITIEGRIDRLDICRVEDKNYFRVIDYKSGNKSFNPADLYHRIELQLIIYLWAVLKGAKTLFDFDALPAGAFYFTIDDPLIETDDTDKEAITKLLARQLKMSGLVLSEQAVAAAMDAALSASGSSSDVIPLSVNVNGEIAQTGSGFSADDMLHFINYAKESAEIIAAEIMKGTIRIEPYKKGAFISCQYCDYDAICQFDQRFEDHNCRQIRSLKKHEALMLIKKAKEETNNGLD